MIAAAEISTPAPASRFGPEAIYFLDSAEGATRGFFPMRVRLESKRRLKAGLRTSFQTSSNAA
jgi:hypothetical protein